MLCLSIRYFEKTLAFPQFSVQPLAVPAALRAVFGAKPFTCIFFCPIALWCDHLGWLTEGFPTRGSASRQPEAQLFSFAFPQWMLLLCESVQSCFAQPSWRVCIFLPLTPMQKALVCHRGKYCLPEPSRWNEDKSYRNVYTGVESHW